MSKRRFSAKQKLQRLENVAKISEARRQTRIFNQSASPRAEVLIPRDAPSRFVRELEDQLRACQTKVAQKNRVIRNKTQQIVRVKARCRELAKELSNVRRSLKMRTVRSKKRKTRNRQKPDSKPTFALKKKGVVVPEMQSVVRRLVAIGVPECNVGNVVLTVADGIGVRIDGEISPRTVGRIVEAGGIAAQIQIVDEVQSNGSIGHTISSDGTTIRHRTFEARHVTLPVPSYTGEKETVKTIQTRVLGLSTAVNHTAETQFAGLKKMVGNCYNVYNNSPLGKSSPTTIRAFASNLLGGGGDHAGDQFKLANFCEDWKVESKKYLRGESIAQSMDVRALIPIILNAAHAKITAIGGQDVWDTLTEEEQQKYDDQAMEEVCQKFGEEAWNSLSEEDRKKAALFIYAGCCMHKELNSVKGGAQSLLEYWREDGNGPGPIHLMNKDKEAAVIASHQAGAGRETSKEQAGSREADGSGDEEETSTAKPSEAKSPSECAAIKLTSLAGALFKHKDSKKGQQDTYKMYFERVKGYSIAFPDTSNTRFQSHCNAAAELVVHHSTFLAFLLFVRDKKGDRTFNHMELNVYRGLMDLAILTELCVLAIYAEVLSKQYMLEVRPGGDLRVNALSLSDLHARVLAFCTLVAANPDLVLCCGDGAYLAGTLNGKLWDRPDVMYAVAALAPSLPHLRGCITAFFKGAHTVWKRLTTEFSAGGAISTLTQQEKDSIFINSTNDHNEGLLGTARIYSRNMPTISVSKMNAKLMYGRNNTENYITAKLTDKENQAYIRRLQREREKSGIDKREREEEMRQEAEAVEAKRRKITETERKKREKEAEWKAKVDAVEPDLDLERLRQNGKKSTGSKLLTIPEIRVQLAWHRRLDSDKQMLDEKLLNSNTRRPTLLMHLITAVEIYHKRRRAALQIGPHQPPPPPPPSTYSQPDPSLDNPVLSWDEREDLEDC